MQILPRDAMVGIRNPGCCRPPLKWPRRTASRSGEIASLQCETGEFPVKWLSNGCARSSPPAAATRGSLIRAKSGKKVLNRSPESSGWAVTDVILGHRGPGSPRTIPERSNGS